MDVHILGNSVEFIYKILNIENKTLYIVYIVNLTAKYENILHDWMSLLAAA